MKVAFGISPENGNMVFLPYRSDDIKYDSILPKHLEVIDDMSEKVKELILLSRNYNFYFYKYILSRTMIVRVFKYIIIFIKLKTISKMVV